MTFPVADKRHSEINPETRPLSHEKKCFKTYDTFIRYELSF